MNNFDKSVLAFQFIQSINQLSLFADDYYQILSAKYPNIDESNFTLGERKSTSSSGSDVTHRLLLQISYQNKCIKLQIQKTWRNEENNLPNRKYIRAIQYNYNFPSHRSSQHWISHLGASMYYGNYQQNIIEVSSEEIELLTTYECNSLLQGNTEELEFQYSTIHPFNDLTMIQYGLLSLLTADNIRDTVNVIAPDLSMWEDSLVGIDEVIHLFREGILTI